MEELLIPLFPLEVVLFPGQVLPLHIFEERYKTMIRECIDGAPAGRDEFGVVLAKENAILNVGCSAVVTRVAKEYPDGRMDILTVGKRRFEVLFVDQNRDYLRAAAQFFQDEDSATPEPLKTTVIELHHQVIELLGAEAEGEGAGGPGEEALGAEGAEPELSPEEEEETEAAEAVEAAAAGVAGEPGVRALSFRLTGPLPLDLDFKQLLLTMRSEPERLERVSEYFQRLLPRLRMANWARTKAGGNGQCRH